MNRNYSLISCLGTILLTTSVAVAQEEAEIIAKITTSQTHDIDFDTSTLSLGVRAVTSYGLIQCDYSRESGETRIDTFDDVFGTDSVLSAPWNDYDADKLQCGYGLKMPLAGGELTSGIGMMRYSGETDTTDDGKKIVVDAISIKASYKHGDYDTDITLMEKQYSFLYHYLLKDYDSDTRGKVRTIELTGKWGPVHTEVEYVQGNKEREFTTPLFPYADFEHTQTTFSLGPAFSGSMGPLRYIAPTYITGSESGSFNSLDIDSGLRGAVVGMVFNDTQLRLSYLDIEAAGTRDYTPVTDDLAEAKQTTKLALELKAEKWSAKLENKKTVHDGFITVDNVVIDPFTPIVFPYAGIVGCDPAPCSYNNYRKEDEWKFSWRYSYSPTIALHGDLYQRQRKDKQYELTTHSYRESGGKIGVAVTF